MHHASLFSGIGGFDLAAEWAGWENAFNCEIDPFCRKVLKYHFPKAEQYGNIKTTDFTVWRGRIDVLTGGFPCQPFSVAGKRRGTEDDRHLWPEMLRAIREIAPRWVVGENVLGIVNWSDGLVFEQVCADLEAEGYEVLPFVLPAAGVDAPHLRYRTWFVAHRADAGPETMPGREIGTDRTGASSDAHSERFKEQQFADQSSEPGQSGRRISSGDVADASDIGCRPWCGERCEVREWGVFSGEQERNSMGRAVAGHYCERPASDCESERLSIAGTTRDRRAGLENDHTTFDRFPSQSPVCSRDDELSMRLDGITVPKWRQESIKAYGNAVVPELVRRIFDTINRYEQLNNPQP
jgi:DNA (cytosine-5)-methyltransferase 1